MGKIGTELMGNKNLCIPVAQGETIQEASMVAIGTDGYAVAAVKKEGLKVAGCAMKYVDNSKGKAGDEHVLVRRGAFFQNNDGTIKMTDLLKDCYVTDKNTVTITAEGSSRAGTILGVEENGVIVEMMGGF